MTASPTDTATRTNRAAPVVSRHEVVVAAPPPVVRALHADVAGWPTWNTGIDDTGPIGPLTAGAMFRWQTAGMDITSTVTQIDPLHRVVWGGTAHGITGMQAVLDTSLQTWLRDLRLAAGTHPAHTIGEPS